MQFNLYITVKNPELYTPGGLEAIVHNAMLHAGMLHPVLPDMDEIVHLHEDSEVQIQMNRSE